MRFTQSFNSILTTGLLATTALAGVIKPTKVGRRDLDDDDFKSISEASCGGGGIIKRSMNAARADVGLDDAIGAGPDETITTSGLSTCIGMVVTGVAQDGADSDTHFMAHLVMSEPQDVFDKLKGLVDDANLIELKTYITLGDLNTDSLRTVMEESAEDGDDIEDDDVEGYSEYLSELFDDMKSQLSGIAPILGENTHDLNAENTMESAGDGTVKVNDQVIS